MNILEQSVFRNYQDEVWHEQYQATILVQNLIGGTPSDPKVIEGWINSKLGQSNEQLIHDLIAKTIVERQVEMPEATDIVADSLKLNGFRKNRAGELLFEGRKLKAAVKEAANIAWPKRKWGPTNKGTRSFFGEHVFVLEDDIPLGKSEPDYIQQRFVNTWRGNSIVNEEVFELQEIPFTVVTNTKGLISADDWATLWTIGQMQGTGATRSMGYGRYAVTRWDFIDLNETPAPKKTRTKRAA